MSDRRSKIIAIIALVVGVAGLSIGFAAFTQTLRIENSAAEVKPSNSLNVHFPTSGQLVPTGSDTDASGTTISLNSGTLITGLKAYLQKPGQSVTYTTSIINGSSYPAYLRAVTLSKNGVATCSPFTATTNPNPASSSTLTSVCGNMKMYVTVGSTGSELVKEITTSQSNIANKSIPANGSVPVVIKIAYTGTAVPDGDFQTDFGNINFDFSSENYSG